jgi:hypothetical protein
MYKKSEAGAVNPLVVSNALLAILVIVFGSIMVWAYINYQDQKNNVDAKIGVAVADAKKVQSATDLKDFTEREKSPYKQFVGPDDLGHVTFTYPKTWSAYVASSTSSGFSAYLHPNVVPTVSPSTQYALRVSIQTAAYERTLDGYQSLVKKGDLRSSSVTVSGLSGVRLDGNFSKTLKGSMVIFKIRDKSLMIATDAEIFQGDFDKVIIPSLSFNP